MFPAFCANLHARDLRQRLAHVEKFCTDMRQTDVTQKVLRHWQVLFTAVDKKYWTPSLLGR